MTRHAHVTPSCEFDPLWYDCDRGPFCEVCPWAGCGDCGQLRQDCECAEVTEVDEEDQEQAALSRDWLAKHFGGTW